MDGENTLKDLKQKPKSVWRTKQANFEAQGHFFDV